MGDRDRIRQASRGGAIDGTVAYLTILVLLEEDRTDAGDAAAIPGTAFVFWLAHVDAHLVPRIAAEGRLRTDRVLETAQDQVGILVLVAIPLIPLVLAMVGLLEDRVALRAATVAGVLSLGAFAIRVETGGGARLGSLFADRCCSRCRGCRSLAAGDLAGLNGRALQRGCWRTPSLYVVSAYRRSGARLYLSAWPQLLRSGRRA